MKEFLAFSLVILSFASVRADTLSELERQVESATSAHDSRHDANLSRPDSLPERGTPEPGSLTSGAPPQAVLPHAHQPGHPLLEAFNFDFMRRAALAGLLAGAICTWLGSFVVLRRLVFVSVALAQVASAGVAMAVLAGLAPAPIALGAALLAALACSRTRGRGVLPPDAYMGVMYVLAGALAILFLSKSGTGEAEQLEMLHGNLLIVPASRVWVLAAAALGVAVFHVVGHARLLAIAFDPVSSAVSGLRVWLWELAFFVALGAGIALTVQSCGLLLVFAYMVVPASTGLLAGVRLPGVLALGLACQAASTLFGLWIAYEKDLPAGPAIVATMVVLMVLTAGARALKPSHRNAPDL
ncbi:MAG: metal ABC transporter permease [Candidatus Riflebacteria bacterium]|nr:metal ABC transporter permease [Candidatus Riflebacteria bacterium]